MDRACDFELDVTEQDVTDFSRLSGDRNPLHLDPVYAGTTEFGRPIAHGALLVGLVSRVLGMHLPGERSLLLGMTVRFPKPLFYPGRVKVAGRLQRFDDARKIGTVNVVITDVAKLWPVLEADVTFSLHEVTSDGNSRSKPDHGTVPSVTSRPKTACRRLLITGGTGGLGARLTPVLAGAYDLQCLTRQAPKANGAEHLSFDEVDVETAGELEAYLQGLPPEEFYGIIHLSVPPVPRGFVSDDLDAVRRHLRHGVEVPLLLAQWARRSGSSVKRLVLCGSTFGSKFPKPQLGAYALGKAAMEYLPRLLTADLAAQGATVNIVIPTVLPVGLNEGMPERAKASLEAKMPTRRLVSPEDVARVVEFLLSDAAAQVNGATIAVDGGVSE